MLCSSGSEGAVRVGQVWRRVKDSPVRIGRKGRLRWHAPSQQPTRVRFTARVRQPMIRLPPGCPEVRAPGKSRQCNVMGIDMIRSSGLRRCAVTCVAVVVAATMSGCSVDVVTAPIPSSVPATPSPSSSEESSSDELNDPATAVATASESEKATRSYWESQVNLETECPGGRVVVSESRQVVKITARCQNVRVTAPFVTILAEDVGTLNVVYAGSFGHFIIRKLDRANVAAPFSYLYWDSGNPSVKVSGMRTVAKKNPTR